MRPVSRLIARAAPVAAAASVAALVLFAAAAPAVAKEGMQARLDAPVGRDTPGGTELIVGMTLTVLEGSVLHPVDGSPIYIKLTGPDGSSTRGYGEEGSKRGHYTARIVVPRSGVTRLEIGIHGSGDVAIEVLGEPLVAGGISASTAQVAPALPAKPTPYPVASAAAVAPAVAGPAVEPAAEAGTPGSAWAVAVVAVVAAVTLGLLAIALGRWRRRDRGELAHPAPGMSSRS